METDGNLSFRRRPNSYFSVVVGVRDPDRGVGTDEETVPVEPSWLKGSGWGSPTVHPDPVDCSPH